MATPPKQNLVSLKSLYSPPLIKRVGQAISYALAGGWFSPGTPMQPTHPETAGRRFDYVANMNLWIQPKRDSGINFESLRNFARLYDILRICLETRKDQIAAFEWEVAPEDESIEGADVPPAMKADMQRVKDFFENPDPNSMSLGWDGWLRSVVEDIFVLDAVCLYPTFKGKECVGLPIVDPSTIKIVIDESGRVPQPPYPAFQQVLHGIPTSQYRRDEMAYFMRNPRSDAIYGYSVVEQIAMTINIGLRREVSQLQYFTEGNVPEALAGVPDTWDGAQIAQYQTWWDSIMEGNTGQRRHLKFVPGDASKILFSKNIEATLKGEFDEWIARIICYSLSLSPTPFVKQVNRATAESAKDTANEEGITPLLNYIRGIMNFLIKNYLKIQGVQFRWEVKEDVDAAKQATVDDLYVRNGVYSIDDVRQRLGQESLGVPNLIYLPTGPIPVAQFIKDTPEFKQAAADKKKQDDLQTMQVKAKVAGPPGGAAKPGAAAKKPAGNKVVKMEDTRVLRKVNSREEQWRVY